MKTATQERLQEMTLAVWKKFRAEFQHKYDSFVEKEAARLHKEILDEAEKAAARGLTGANVEVNYHLTLQDISDGFEDMDWEVPQYMEDLRQIHLYAKDSGLKDVKVECGDLYIKVREKMADAMTETWGINWIFTWGKISSRAEIKVSWF